MGQLTRVILPFLLIEATICPRSSPHLIHICSTRSPTAKACFSFSSILLLQLARVMCLAFFLTFTDHVISRDVVGRTLWWCCAHSRSERTFSPARRAVAHRQSPAARL